MYSSTFSSSKSHLLYIFQYSDICLEYCEGIHTHKYEETKALNLNNVRPAWMERYKR